MSIAHPDDSIDQIDPKPYRFSRVTWVNATPAAAYELISNVGNVSKWSPNVADAVYDEGAGPREGDWFTGHNEAGDARWTSRSQVSRAEPGVGFGYVVAGVDNGIVQWEWTFQESGSGCEVRQTWQLLRTDPVLGKTRADVDNMRDLMTGSVEATLVSLARWIAENPAN
ncbi:SRPBCC family protein [Kitasatospora acidiphila]|uniref:SRPBCC family protein n=1 Tax=Kitasatospora acidiphila TaxID=2567942 RepID=A0A540W1U5_9ACTN|nr:SRPBCC family protein [Kitasatospora acidiphila]TQF02998.1 SRPBCC family protein [Kitasatospora acidiphila]